MLLFAVSCSEGDSGTDSNGEDAEAWVGKWLSAGDNIAPLLTSFSIDSIYVTMNEDGSMAKLEQLEVFAKKHDLIILTVKDLVKHIKMSKTRQ